MIELSTPGSRLFLAVLMDLYSRIVVGWAVSAVNNRHPVIEALGEALKRRTSGAALLHHTDQGSPYASEDYQKLLKDNGIICSMSRRGNCFDNAAIESCFSSPKATLGERFDSVSKAKTELFDYIEVLHNRQRRPSALRNAIPAEYERSTAIQTVAA